MQDEYDSLMEHETWIVVKPPPHSKVLEPKWIFKVKEDNKGQPIKYKARLVVKGFMQQYGLDYYDTFAGVTRYESVRLLIQIALARNMHVIQFDVKTAFLNGTLEETIYMRQPEGFESGTREEVCLLKKSLYGLKQAPRCWKQTLTSALKETGLVEITSDPCVYHNVENTIYLAVYVDDGLLMGMDQKELNNLLVVINSKFEITSSAPDTFIGMQLVREGQSVIISQKLYVEKLLDKYGMNDCKASPIPMQPNLQLTKPEESKPGIPYRELIGSLLFLARVSRPDIMFAVNKMAQFNSAHTDEHFCHVKQILRYLSGTRNLGLQLRK
jgi:hypothetical protein